MRAIKYDRTGDVEVLRLVEAPEREPGDGEVLVRIARSGVNPTDWKSRRGSEPGIPVEPAQVPNQDGSGVVEAVGPGVEAALRGSRVWIWEAAYQRADGTAQELTIVPARQTVPLPDSASFDLGASLGIPYMTAHRCLTVAEEGPDRLGPGTLDGRVVLVTGGAGAVGHAAIQLAKWSDATVIATVSSAAKAQLAAAAGADHVIDYTAENVAEMVRRVSPRGADMIVEVAAALNADSAVQSLAPNGAVAAYADTGREQVSLPIRPLMQLNARWQFVLIYTVSATAKRLAVEDISAAVLDGAVSVGHDSGLPLLHFPLEQTAQAHAAVQDGVVGKVLVDIT